MAEKLSDGESLIVAVAVPVSVMEEEKLRVSLAVSEAVAVALDVPEREGAGGDAPLESVALEEMLTVGVPVLDLVPVFEVVGLVEPVREPVIVDVGVLLGVVGSEIEDVTVKDGLRVPDVV